MRRILRFVALAILIPLGLYLGSAAVLGHVASNGDWREPGIAEPGSVTIYVQTNGVHTGIVVPAVSAGRDWRMRVPASDLPDPTRAGKWLAFGWGDRDFYLNTPRWQDIRPWPMFRALTGSSTTLVHVDHLDDFATDENWRPLRLRADEYRRLSDFIDATFAERPAVTRGYTARDVFYTARGRYSAFTTCNVWTGNALRRAGVKTGMWTPFESDVMRWVPQPGR